MWLLLAFTSALLLGLYDVAKKQALRDNAVLPVLLLNTLFSSLLFLPTILSTAGGWGWFDATPLRCPAGDLHAHLLVVLKSCIVLSSWVFGYFGIKHLPLTIVGPINATRPVMTLVGAMLIFGERLNGYQWVGVVLAIGSLFLLSPVEPPGKGSISVTTSGSTASPRPPCWGLRAGCTTSSSRAGSTLSSCRAGIPSISSG